MLSLLLGTLIFSQSLSDLGNDDFDTRDAATAKMQKEYPSSALSLYFGLYNKDPEVRYRCNLILRKVKAESIIMAKKINNPKIIKFLTNNDYPRYEDSLFLEDTEDWSDFCDVLVYCKIHNPEKETLSQRDKERVYWTMWSRFKTIRSGKDPKVGVNQLPEIIRTILEIKK